MHRSYIGMGGNVASLAGPPEQTLAAAVEQLESLGRVLGSSSLYSTDPVGFADQPRFVNAVVALQADLDPRTLLEALLRIERDFGRDRSSGILNGPRTLDLDILLLDQETIHQPGLDIPHPRLEQRAFVLVPLAEVAMAIGDSYLEARVTQWLYALRRRVPVGTEAVIPLQSTVWRAGLRHASSRANPRRPDRRG